MQAAATRGILGAITVVWLLLAASPGAAFELFGFRFFEGDEAEDPNLVDILDPLPYSVVPDIATGDDSLRKALLAASDVWTRRDRPASGAAGLIVTARGDYRRLLATLYTRGHYSGTINIVIAGREAAALPLTATLPAPVEVRLMVDPGPSYLFGDTGFRNGPQPFSLGENAPGETARRQFTTGAPARADVIDDVGLEAVEVWRLRGYPKAEVVDREVVADHAVRRVDATIVMDPGREARFGRVGVRGSRSIEPEFIRYMADIPTGARFNPAKTQEAEDRLMRLDVFQSVRVVEGETINRSGALPTRVEVRDRKPRRIGFGATLSTLDGAGVEAFWLHRNLFGQAERLRFDASIKGIDTVTGFRDLDYLFGVSYRVPGVLNPDTNFNTGFTVEQSLFDLYRERKVGVSVGLDRWFNEAFQAGAFFDVSFASVEYPFTRRDFLTFGVNGEAQYDRRNDPLDASAGYYLAGTLRPFYEVKFQSAAIRAEIDARGYLGFGRDDGTVLAGRIGLGTVVGGNLRDLPPDELFFAGGGGSVRGYGFRSIGTDVDGETLGGRSLLELSGELRQRITSSIGVVAFADAGYVSTHNYAIGDFDPLVGVGGGIRYKTGLGPLRLDVATPLDRRPGDPSVAIYIGLGQAF